MTILKVLFPCVLLFFAPSAKSQGHFQGDYQRLYLNAKYLPEFPGKEDRTFTSSPDLTTRTEAIYNTLQNGVSEYIKPYLSGKINWNGKENFCFPLDIPSLSELFDPTIPGWANWRLYDMTYHKLYNNTIEVNGRYRVIHHDREIEAPFVHVWKWNNGKVVSFQKDEVIRATTGH